MHVLCSHLLCYNDRTHSLTRKIHDYCLKFKCFGRVALHALISVDVLFGDLGDSDVYTARQASRRVDDGA